MNNVPFHTNIEIDTLQNPNYRKVLFTGHLQLVLMSLKPGEEIGSEIHEDHDQFFRIEQGEVTAVLNDVPMQVVQDEALIVPAGTKHNIINNSAAEVKLYTIYAPAEHPADTIQVTKP